MTTNSMTLKDTLKLLKIEKVSDCIQGYFGYYAGKFNIDISEKSIMITIPFKEGSAKLDRYFLKVLLENGYQWHESWLLSEIYMTKAI